MKKKEENYNPLVLKVKTLFIVITNQNKLQDDQDI